MSIVKCYASTFYINIVCIKKVLNGAEPKTYGPYISQYRKGTRNDTSKNRYLRYLFERLYQVFISKIAYSLHPTKIFLLKYSKCFVIYEIIKLGLEEKHFLLRAYFGNCGACNFLVGFIWPMLLISEALYE